jgi:hypothetical protein
MWRFILELLRTETKRESMRKSRSETIRERKRETTHQERVVEMWRSLRIGGGGRFIQCKAMNEVVSLLLFKTMCALLQGLFQRTKMPITT